jgi:hypothetical protein
MSKPTRPDRQGTEKWAAKAEQYIDALEAENAELRESVQFNKDVAAEQARDYLASRGVAADMSALSELGEQ